MINRDTNIAGGVHGGVNDNDNKSKGAFLLENNIKVNELDIAGTRINIKWSKKKDKDYYELSKNFVNAAYITLKEIIEVNHNNNTKYDMWFLPAVYMLRQGIELLLKSGIAKNTKSNIELQDIFVDHKHDLEGLLDTCIEKVSEDNLSNEERAWLQKYINSIELVDKNSDLFRYRFKDDFLSNTEGDYLDIISMADRLFYCYSTIHRMLFDEWYHNEVLDINEEPDFLETSITSGIMCHLWKSPWSDGSYKNITGYSEVSKLLFDNFLESKDKTIIYPIVFLMRNAIEICLKTILESPKPYSVVEGNVKYKTSSHRLYKDLWIPVQSILIQIGPYKRDLEQIEELIKWLDKMDKKGDVFRYPCTFSHEYKFNDVEVDVVEYHYKLQEMFHTIDIMADILNERYEFEKEW